jgi:hypothetical protein
MAEWRYISTVLDLGMRRRKISSQLHSPADLILGRSAAGAHWVGVMVGLRASLEDLVKIQISFLSREPNPERPACNSSQYGLSYIDNCL